MGLDLGSKVCKKKKEILEASTLFQHIFYDDNQLSDCPMPCHFITNLFSPMEANDNDWMWLHFNKFIKAQYIY